MSKLERIRPLYDAFKEYGKVYTNRGADYSVTDLIKSPRQVLLFKRHWQEVRREVDIISQLGSFRGTAIHEQFKKLLWKVVNQTGGDDDYMIETRLWDRINGRRISGAIDCLYRRDLYDFKNTSVWKKIFGDYSEWENQLNLYVFMLSIYGRPVDRIFVICWYQDWEKHNVFGTDGYPISEMEQISIPLWSTEDQIRYMYDRIDVMKNAELLSDDELPYCTAEDMWAKDDAYAAYLLGKNGKIGNRATRVLPTKAAIDSWIQEQLIKKGKENNKYEVFFRPGERTKCKDWCSVNSFCSQYKEYLGGK